MSTSSPVIVHREPPLAVLTLSNPGKRNAFSGAMREALWVRLLELSSDAEVRALVITGAGGHFCAGGDISEMRDRTYLEGRERFTFLGRIVRLMAEGPKPIVAAVEGNCVGAGLSMAALADIVIAARGAHFGAAFIKIGLIPDMGGLWSVQQRVGRAKAREMFSLGRLYGGEAALSMGLANELVDDGRALERAREVALEYAALPPAALAALRATLASGSDTLADCQRSEVDQQSALMTTADHREAVAAFLAKRKPVFVGR
jgi:enoyl-CoA hydratase/carnithine racemase